MVRYELLDAQGKVIMNESFKVDGKWRHLIKNHNLRQGMYFVKVYFEDEVYQLRLSKQ